MSALRTGFVEEDLLKDEGGHGFAELRAVLHDAQAERDDLGGEEKVDHLLLVSLEKRNGTLVGHAREIERRLIVPEMARPSFGSKMMAELNKRHRMNERPTQPLKQPATARRPSD